MSNKMESSLPLPPSIWRLKLALLCWEILSYILDLAMPGRGGFFYVVL